MYGTEDRLTTMDVELAVSNIFADSAIADRRLYPISHPVTRAHLGAVTVTDECDALTLTVTDASGDVTETVTAAREDAADRVASIVRRIACAGVEPSELRDARLTSLRYVGSAAAHAKEQRAHLVREARDAGASYAQLIEATGLSRSHLDRIVNGRSW